MGPIELSDGSSGTVVLLGPAEQPKNLVLVTRGADESGVAKTPFKDCLIHLSPAQVIDVLCMQERAFGTHGLTPPELT